MTHRIAQGDRARPTTPTISDVAVERGSLHFASLVVSLTFALSSLCIGGPVWAQDDPEPPAHQEGPPERVHTHRELRDHYFWGTFGPPALAAAALSSGLQQWRDSPREWEQSGSGYAKRFASEFAESAIGDTTKYLISWRLHEDPSFWPCQCSGLGPRLRHAVLAPFHARKPDGRPVFSAARIAGTAASHVISSATWSPGRQGPGSVAGDIGVSLAAQVGVDIIREFFVHKRTPPGQ